MVQIYTGLVTLFFLALERRASSTTKPSTLMKPDPSLHISPQWPVQSRQPLQFSAVFEFHSVGMHNEMPEQYISERSLGICPCNL